MPTPRFKAAAFDLDGTLYANYRLNLRLVPFLLREWRFVLAFGRARTAIRRLQVRDEAGSSLPAPNPSSYYRFQAELMARSLHQSADRILDKTEHRIYREWVRHFHQIPLFPHVRETLDAFRAAGLKTGLLSDFPPAEKLAALGLDTVWDTAFSSEETGRLKPHRRPFDELARRLGLPPSDILYVGNSPRYDVAGALNAGMSAALIKMSLLPSPASLSPSDDALASPFRGSVYTFSDYRQLREYVLT